MLGAQSPMDKGLPVKDLTSAMIPLQSEGALDELWSEASRLNKREPMIGRLKVQRV